MRENHIKEKRRIDRPGSFLDKMPYLKADLIRKSYHQAKFYNIYEESGLDDQPPAAPLSLVKKRKSHVTHLSLSNL